ncbi:MAG: hypothetical protein US30_C0007G0015 [Candidatus Moranbacteria bacterium GW2011_GWF2_36_839]|nr:MAG: hypothetical protein US27_C0007G0035 [Candidatus Moranbacteria bacterium GW2011_GWF1_36_78]KKQ17069.1 MAG: hypothetical protein US30_C0007G0015 [Candidatus Moranbacteria bacterium GW2011_GWF2_36_839]HAT73672.1 hypothetical protein [Candidatus Moranbacteria bacterium]HBY11352.1 hypothetical protein [Candidatus Moranbacteria bacterium]
MSITKKAKDYLLKAISGKDFAPQGLVDINRYFRLYGPINFEFKKEGDAIVGISTNFRFGSIVTSGKDEKELDKNIKDAILTSFEVASSYAKEAGIKNLNECTKEDVKNKCYQSYALA